MGYQIKRLGYFHKGLIFIVNDMIWWENPLSLSFILENSIILWSLDDCGKHSHSCVQLFVLVTLCLDQGYQKKIIFVAYIKVIDIIGVVVKCAKLNLEL